MTKKVICDYYSPDKNSLKIEYHLLIQLFSEIFLSESRSFNSQKIIGKGNQAPFNVSFMLRLE